MGRLVGIALLIVALVASAGPALAQKRVALVIGNSAYQHAGVLANPKNDAADMAAALKKHGITVIEGYDLDKAAFDRKVRDFASALKGAEAGIFFYAGHGLQVSGQNYLVPIDAKAEGAETLEFEMVRVNVIHGVMEQLTSTNILFLDACRNNPLARNLARSMGTRSTLIGRGLRGIESGLGTLISFSTAPDTVASDGSGRNSPYTGALVKHIAAATEDLAGILVAVRNDVILATRKEQVPWEHSALIGRFYFGSVPSTAEPPKVAPSPLGQAAAEWDTLRTNTDIAELETFAARHAGTYFADLARARIDELKKQKTALVQKPPSPPAKPLTMEEERSLKPKDTFKECDDCPEMVVLPAGEFMMGSPAGEEGRSDNEGPQRKVTIAKPFAVGKFEVTFAEWDACVSAGGCKHKPDDQGWGRRKRPAINVSWDVVTNEYLPWLSRTTGRTYRLLTEAEWEYAARAGTTTPFSTGRTITTEQANFNGDYTYGGSAKGVYRQKTVEVGSFKANAFGLYDMHGNVWEWVQDCWKAGYAGTPTDGTALTSGDCTYRVLRGGSWFDFPQGLRSAYRSGGSLGNRDYGTGLYGFRLARTLSP